MNLLKKTLPLAFGVVVGLYAVAEFYLPHHVVPEITTEIKDIAALLGAAAFILGGLNLIQVTAPKIRRRERDWQYKIIMLVSAAPTELYVDEYGMTQSEGGNGSVAVIGGLLIGLGALISLAISLWNRVFKMGRTGQSVGKKVIGLKLVDDKTGQPIGAGMCFLREVVSNVVNQVIYLSYLWMLWDDNKQTIADKAVHSTVVVVPKG